jgi:hypothetical protein
MTDASAAAEHAAKVGRIFCWHELMSNDVEKAKAFYGELLGWKTSEMTVGEHGSYTIFHETEGDPGIAGMMGMDGPEWEGIPPHWMMYIMVDDVDAQTARVTELGGNVCVPPTDIPNIGRFAVVQDPTGATFSLFTSANAEG